MCSKSVDPAGRTQHSWRDIFPAGRTGDLFVENVMDGHRVGRNRPPRIDHQCATLIVDGPSSTVFKDHILPADLADVIRSVAGRFQIDDANAGCRRCLLFSRPSVVAMLLVRSGRYGFLSACSSRALFRPLRPIPVIEAVGSNYLVQQGIARHFE
ncbi:hypothetical protein D9M72_487950 [compost metagenome]